MNLTLFIILYFHYNCFIIFKIDVYQNKTVIQQQLPVVFLFSFSFAALSKTPNINNP